MESCPNGAYCIVKSERPEFCNIGTYMITTSTPSSSSSDCKQCTPGYYCPFIGMTDSTMETLPCDEGYYCTLGSKSQRSNKCPIGSYCEGQVGGTGKIIELSRDKLLVYLKKLYFLADFDSRFTF
jgi:hypothetical protein